MTGDERAWPHKGMSLLQAVSGAPWRANAQMYLGPDWVAYQHGYELATRLLLERAASGRDQDVLIFPILFNARQAIELALKEIVVIGIRLGHTEPYPMTHDLLTLWAVANGVLVEAGAADEKSATAFEALLHELHIADPTAITFRYPEDTKRRPSFHAADGPIPKLINTKDLADALHAMFNFLLGARDWLENVADTLDS